MSRYVSRATEGWHQSLLEPLLKGETVHEPAPIDTGLLEAAGNRVFRVMNQIGFVPRRERE